MKVSIICGASHAYACIKAPNYSMDVRLQPGKSAEKSLLESAEELRKKADRYLEQATRMERAAQMLKKDAAI